MVVLASEGRRDLSRAVDAGLGVARALLATLGEAIDLMTSGEQDRLRAEARRLADSYAAMDFVAVGGENRRFVFNTKLPPPHFPPVEAFKTAPSDQGVPPWVTDLAPPRNAGRDSIVLDPVSVKADPMRRRVRGRT